MSNCYKDWFVGVHRVVIISGFNLLLVACGWMHDSLVGSWLRLEVLLNVVLRSNIDEITFRGKNTESYG